MQGWFEWVNKKFIVSICSCVGSCNCTSSRSTYRTCSPVLVTLTLATMFTCSCDTHTRYYVHLFLWHSHSLLCSPVLVTLTLATTCSPVLVTLTLAIMFTCSCHTHTRYYVHLFLSHSHSLLCSPVLVTLTFATMFSCSCHTHIRYYVHWWLVIVWLWLKSLKWESISHLPSCSWWWHWWRVWSIHHPTWGETCQDGYMCSVTHTVAPLLCASIACTPCALSLYSSIDLYVSSACLWS